MRRLSADLLDRARKFAHRVVDVAEGLGEKPRDGVIRARVIDQMMGCGTSVAANVHEADEAMSRTDFCKCLGIALKELGEARFWLEFVGERGWVRSNRLEPLLVESRELSRILNSMVARTRRKDQAHRAVAQRKDRVQRPRQAEPSESR